MGLSRATSMLQEVGLLLLWLFSTLRVVWLCLAPRGMFGCILNYGKLPYLILRISRILGLVFGWETK